MASEQKLAERVLSSLVKKFNDRGPLPNTNDILQSLSETSKLDIIKAIRVHDALLGGSYMPVLEQMGYEVRVENGLRVLYPPSRFEQAKKRVVGPIGSPEF
jgi:hypothetical protein